MAFYTDENGNVVNDVREYSKPKKAKIVRDFSLAKVFGYMFIGLLITAVVAFGLGAIFAGWMMNDFDTATNTLFFVMIGSAIATIVLSIVINFSLRKNKVSAIAIPAIIYAICIGVLLSSFTIFMDWWLLGYAFGITAVIFGLMALISIFTKGNMSGVAIVGMGLLFGALIMSLGNFFIALLFPAAFETWYWIVTLLLLAGMMFITMWDIHRIKQICDQGAMSNNLALYCAFTLYVDFIYIFIRILIIISHFSNNN